MFRIMQTDTAQMLKADVQEPDDYPEGDTQHIPQRQRQAQQGMSELPTDGELLHRWTKGMGLTDPVLLGSDSFGRGSAPVVAILSAQNQQLAQDAGFTPFQQQMIEQLHHAPAIGTFYTRLAPGEDVLRIDALASIYGRSNVRLLNFAQAFVPHTTAYPIMRRLLREYGGLSVYNAALYVVDHEVRLRAETVNSIYLPVLRRQLNYPIQYNHSTRHFHSLNGQYVNKRKFVFVERVPCRISQRPPVHHLLSMDTRPVSLSAKPALLNLHLSATGNFYRHVWSISSYQDLKKRVTILSHLSRHRTRPVHM